MSHPARIFAAQQTNHLSHGVQFDMSHPRILVVGAGFAGLGAARRLKNAGFKDVVVLEASERVGGRANTIEVCSPPTAVAIEDNLHSFQDPL